MTIRHAPQTRIDLLAAGFVVARLAYIGFYLANLASLRSTAWTIGMLCTVAIFAF
ncbi:MAG: MAPEG family protein [Solimonas sp.]